MFFCVVIFSGGCSQDFLKHRAANDSYAIIGCPEEAIKISNGENYLGGNYYYKWVATCNGKKFYCRLKDMSTNPKDDTIICGRAE